MKQTNKAGIIDGFYDDEDSQDNSFAEIKNAIPKAGDIGDAFVNLPITFATPNSHTVYVVHEIRVTYGKTKRCVIGVYDSKQDAEKIATDVRTVLISFLEQYNGRPFQDEMCGGTLVQYWHAGNPLRIVGFKVWIEEVHNFR